MNKGLACLVPGSELNLTNAHQQSATKRSVSVHKTSSNCRTVAVPQVSLWDLEYCAAAPAAITGSATEVGQIDTHAHTHVDKWRWNILYNSLLNIQFTKNSKAVAFADDLILAIRKEAIRAAENISNIEMSKIAALTEIIKLTLMKTSPWL